MTLSSLPDSFVYLGSAKWAGVPASIWIAGLLYVAFGVFLRYSRIGRSIYAIGGSWEAARVAGIPNDRIVWSLYVVGGLLAALAGLMLSGRIASVVSSQGQNMIFYVFAASVIGGIDLNGGKGRLLGAVHWRPASWRAAERLDSLAGANLLDRFRVRRHHSGVADIFDANLRETIQLRVLEAEEQRSRLSGHRQSEADASFILLKSSLSNARGARTAARNHHGHPIETPTRHWPRKSMAKFGQIIARVSPGSRRDFERVDATIRWHVLD